MRNITYVTEQRYDGQSRILTRCNFMRSRRLIPPLLLALALFSPSAGAQDAEPAQAVATPPRTDIPADEFDRGTPLRAGEGFMATVDTGDYEKGAEYLDLRNRDLTGRCKSTECPAAVLLRSKLAGRSSTTRGRSSSTAASSQLACRFPCSSRSAGNTQPRGESTASTV